MSRIRAATSERSLARALLAVLLLGTVACGSTPEGPVVIPTDDLPFAVGRRADTTATTEALTTRRVAFARRGRLVMVPRKVPTDLPPIEAMLRALLAGPTEREADRGIRSSIPATTRLLSVQPIGDGIAQIELSGDFQQASASETLAMRVAQVVWTITEVDGIIGATFLIDGQPVTAVNGRGEAVHRPVNRSDYPDLAPVR